MFASLGLLATQTCFRFYAKLRMFVKRGLITVGSTSGAPVQARAVQGEESLLEALCVRELSTFLRPVSSVPRRCCGLLLTCCRRDALLSAALWFSFLNYGFQGFADPYQDPTSGCALEFLQHHDPRFGRCCSLGSSCVGEMLNTHRPTADVKKCRHTAMFKQCAYLGRAS